MKSFLGASIIQGAAVFDLANDMNEAKALYELARSLYPSFKLLILDLSKIEQRLLVADIDPDIADIKKGFAVVVIAEY